ncbi:hypothetical protein [Rhodanobacter sp. L36]|uniref:hypothetical protein n=1 Tax=Rhodanobacter sp. L36 TaxID=1747221 RepID=UPI00131D9A46|nr:hypothetical protein [Rhodanobacter sp. L36]
MNALRVLWLASIILGMATQVVMLSLQIGALRRYAHRSFWLLALGTTFAAVYAVMGAIPFFVTLSTEALVSLFGIALAFASIGIALGIWGTTSLFRRFGELHQTSFGVNGETA